MVSSIGIKIANGEFYPIMEENSQVKKRLILTTVHDNQPSVQIDLYRSAANSMTDAQYIGSLVVENIKTKPKGEPSIEMVISSSSDGNIIADAFDLDTASDGEHYVLTVSLKSLDETSRNIDIPDYELDAIERPPSGLYQQAQMIRDKRPRSSFLWIFILIGLIIILGLASVWLFMLGGMETVRSYLKGPEFTKTIVEDPAWLPKPAPVPEPVKQAEPEPVRLPEPVAEPEPIIQSETVYAPDPTPVIQAPAEPPAPQPQTAARNRPLAPVASYNVPAVIPRGGVDYRIRWGDTLWDIAEAFYRDPWLFPRIARFNNIRNPDYIISGRILRIPPRN
ncbi:MAG: LysM peptidoglycan-binding domain-containing protein [Treponema sp.]|nr:LysM peptidoglycan-binding domain-containing protein [Treponema sp.]